MAQRVTRRPDIASGRPWQADEYKMADTRLTSPGSAGHEPLGASSLRLLWGAHLVSLTGRWVHAFALGWIVYEITRSSGWLSLIAALGTAPLLPLGLVGGAIADRFDKVRVLLVTQSTAMTLALVTAALVSNDALSPWSLAAVSLVYGLVAAIDAPTLHAYLFEASGEDRALQAAARQSLIFNVTRVAAPVLAAATIALIGASLCFVLNAISFLPLVVFLRRMTRRQAAGRHVSLGQTVRESLGLPLGRPCVMRILIQVVLLNLFAIPCLAFLPALAVKLADGGLWSLGLMTSSLGTGALIAAGALQIAPAFLSSSWLRMPAALALCVGLYGLAGASTAAVQAGWSMLAGAAIALALAHANYVTQTAADRTSRGRLAAWYLIAVLGTAPLGHLVVGFWSLSWGVSRTLQGAALLCGVAVLTTELLFACHRQNWVAARRSPSHKWPSTKELAG